MKRAGLVLIPIACALLGLYVLSLRAAPKAKREGGAANATHESGAPAASGALRYLAVGGGATPEYTEVSLEQDLELAQHTLPGPGVVLFAGGSDSVSVRVQVAGARRDSLLSQLGELFDPRAGRDSRYRKPQLLAQAASVANFEASLAAALKPSAGTQPLWLYVSAHGLQGETPRDNHIELWGSEPISVARLAELVGTTARPMRFVIASCYSGGFAELAFAHADAEQGAAPATRCGVFAGTWDRQTSGCDPNPDRRAQEGYSLHLLHALRGEDREGNRIPLVTLDLDRDGKVSLLEAHTRARITSHSIDVPTTTSERYLRDVEQTPAASAATALLPEDAAVVEQLGARFGLSGAEAAAERQRELSERLDALQDELDAADAAVEQARSQVAALLLARWPVLNDAYHEQFAETLAQAGSDIAQVLRSAPEAAKYRQARELAEALAARANVVDVEEAEVQRLMRAYETLGLAAALAQRGGPQFAHYRALLACERGGL